MTLNLRLNEGEFNVSSLLGAALLRRAFPWSHASSELIILSVFKRI
jgi:hypothetical protein